MSRQNPTAHERFTSLEHSEIRLWRKAQSLLTSRVVRLVRPLCAERFEVVDERACKVPVPGELGRTLGGGPGSATGERRCK